VGIALSAAPLAPVVDLIHSAHADFTTMLIDARRYTRRAPAYANLRSLGQSSHSCLTAVIRLVHAVIADGAYMYRNSKIFKLMTVSIGTPAVTSVEWRAVKLQISLPA